MRVTTCFARFTRSAQPQTHPEDHVMLNEYEIPTVEDLALAEAFEESVEFPNQIDMWDSLL